MPTPAFRQNDTRAPAALICANCPVAPCRRRATAAGAHRLNLSELRCLGHRLGCATPERPNPPSPAYPEGPSCPDARCVTGMNADFSALKVVPVHTGPPSSSRRPRRAAALPALPLWRCRCARVSPRPDHNQYRWDDLHKSFARLSSRRSGSHQLRFTACMLEHNPRHRLALLWYPSQPS